MPPFVIIHKLSENIEILNAWMIPECRKTLRRTQVNFRSMINVSQQSTFLLSWLGSVAWVSSVRLGLVCLGLAWFGLVWLGLTRWVESASGQKNSRLVSDQANFCSVVLLSLWSLIWYDIRLYISLHTIQYSLTILKIFLIKQNISD